MRFLRENKPLLYIAVPALFCLFFLDEAVMVWVKHFRHEYVDIYPFLRTIDRVAYYAAHGTTLIAGALLFYLSCRMSGRLFGRYLNRKYRSAAKSLLIGLIASGIAAQIIKHLIGRARPRLTDSLVVIGPSLKSGYDSFPSGHTAMAFCLACVMSRYFPAYRFWFYLFAVLEGLGRIGSTSHFPSDVLGGAIVGTAVAVAVMAINERLEARKPATPPTATTRS